jgi:hypothetical protein
MINYCKVLGVLALEISVQIQDFQKPPQICNFKTHRALFKARFKISDSDFRFFPNKLNSIMQKEKFGVFELQENLQIYNKLGNYTTKITKLGIFNQFWPYNLANS